ncbi:hypothetical protein CK203_051199 [Vitis vinifera]|uniref:Uncharacterized protein n=1 Tax=Vitis vinifera TaxID=29760 RepID=A0A438HEN4_VITVI|nr:hypothetical protein CK203_051199 [Vitis vinifera]
MAGMSKRLDQIESSHQDYHPIGINIDEKTPHASQTVQCHLPSFPLLMTLDWSSRRIGLKGLSLGGDKSDYRMKSPNEFVSSFVGRWRAKVAGSRESGQLSVLRRPLLEDYRQILFLFPDSKGKRLVGSSSRSGEVYTISYQHQRPTHHSYYRSSTTIAHLSHLQHRYQPVYAQQPYIA